jgi:hypothetical protein
MELMEKNMQLRENDFKKGNIRFTGDDIALAATMLDKISTTMDIIYYLMGRGEERAFVIMLMSAKNVDLDELLRHEKRNTDILFEIDKEKSIYTIICQDTKVDGGYRFAERIMRKVIEKNATDIYLTELEVRTTRYDVKYIIFKVLETFLKIQLDGKEKEIVYNSLT